jgi:hypothetical protein
VILGSNAPLLLDIDGLERVIATRPDVAAELQLIEVEDAYDLLTYFQMERDTMEEFTLGAAMNTDDNMLIEFAAPRRLYEETSSRNYRVLLNEARPALQALRDIEDFKAFSLAYARREEYVRALIVLKEAEARYPGDPEVFDLYTGFQQAFMAEQEAEARRQQQAERELQESYERQRQEREGDQPAAPAER